MRTAPLSDSYHLAARKTIPEAMAAAKPIEQVCVYLRPDGFHQIACQAVTVCGIKVQEPEAGIEVMLRTSGKWSNTLCSSRQCDLLIIPKNRTFGTGLNFSGYSCVYRELTVR